VRDRIRDVRTTAFSADHSIFFLLLFFILIVYYFNPISSFNSFKILGKILFLITALFFFVCIFVFGFLSYMSSLCVICNLGLVLCVDIDLGECQLCAGKTHIGCIADSKVSLISKDNQPSIAWM